MLDDAGVGVGVGVFDGAGVTGALSVGRCNVGRSSELLDGVGDEPGAGVLDGAGVLEVGVPEEDPLLAERWRVGRSSVVTGDGGASDFFAAVTICHLPRAVQPLLLEPLTIVAVPTGIPVVWAS